MSPLTLDVLRKDLQDARCGWVPVNGHHESRCPSCARTLTIQGAKDGEVTFGCASGCDRDRIVNELDFLLRAPVPPAANPLNEPAPTSWAPVALTGVLDGTAVDPPPFALRRTDGRALLYAGRVHWLQGEPEAGKGWIALAATAQLLHDGDRCLYVDFEDTPSAVVGRLQALGVPPDLILERFAYVRPEAPLDAAGRRDLEAAGDGVALAVIDGVTEAMGLDVLDFTSNVDIAKWIGALPRPLARAGAAVLVIDHVVKDREGRGRYAIGGQHKLAGSDVAYSAEVVEPFGRGRNGRVKLTVQKDRPGHVRGFAEDGKAAARVELASLADGAVSVTLEPPDGKGATFRPTVLMARVSQAVTETPGLSTRALREAVTGNNDAKALALELLVAEGYVDARREGQAVKHYPVREYLDEQTVPTVPNRAQSVPRAHVPTVPHPLQGGTGQGTVKGTPTVPNPATAPFTPNGGEVCTDCGAQLTQLGGQLACFGCATRGAAA